MRGLDEEAALDAVQSNQLCGVDLVQIDVFFASDDKTANQSMHWLHV